MKNRAYTSAQVKMAELLADSEGISAAFLMENAGERVAEEVILRFDPKKCVVVCGKGNNGGDGFAFALSLKKRGFDITAILACNMPDASAAQLYFERAEEAGVPVVGYPDDELTAVELICSADLLADAVFGTGYNGNMEESYGRLFGIMNSSKANKISFDIPSGCCADDGSRGREVFCSDITFALGAYKPGHFIYPAAGFCGEVVFCDIGLPERTLGGGIEIAGFESVSKAVLENLKRTKWSNKTDYGRLLILAGSPGMAGAAKLAARAASRSGMGIVELFTDKRLFNAVSSELTVQLTNYYSTGARDIMEIGVIGETETARIVNSAKKASAVVCGCGWASGADRDEVILSILKETDINVALDAGLLHAERGFLDKLAPYAQRLTLTPHAGEFSRLCGKSSACIQEQRLKYARQFVREYGFTLLLKGPDTLIVSPEKTVICAAGSPSMAKGGSGDVLAGVIGAFLAQGTAPEEAAAAAAWCCAKAGEYAAQKYGEIYADAADTIEALSQTFIELEADTHTNPSLKPY